MLRAVPPPAARPRTAFVLSGGASLGASQAGMLKALYELAIVPDLLVAASAGALNAAFVASRPQRVSTAHQLGRIWRTLERDDVFPVSLSALVGGVCGRRDHLVPASGLRRLVRRHVEFEDLSETAIPVHLVTVDLADGRELLLSTGPAVEAVTASAAIPGVFPPVMLDGHCLVDGGMINNTPISHAVNLGAERVYVLPTQRPQHQLQRLPATALDAAICGLGLLVNNRLEADIARYEHRVELIVLPPPDTTGIQPTCFEHSARLIREAYLAARTTLTAQTGGSHLGLVAESG